MDTRSEGRKKIDGKPKRTAAKMHVVLTQTLQNYLKQMENDSDNGLQKPIDWSTTDPPR